MEPLPSEKFFDTALIETLTQTHLADCYQLMPVGDGFACRCVAVAGQQLCAWGRVVTFYLNPATMFDREERKSGVFGPPRARENAVS